MNRRTTLKTLVGASAIALMAGCAVMMDDGDDIVDISVAGGASDNATNGSNSSACLSSALSAGNSANGPAHDGAFENVKKILSFRRSGGDRHQGDQGGEKESHGRSSAVRSSPGGERG